MAEESMKKKELKDGIAKAAALRYKANEDAAPRVTAKGMRKIAEKIIATAREHDIPVREDPELIELLMQVEVGDEIPEELYLLVAEILAFIYKTNRKWKEQSL